ncbi:MAG: hypothetical protein HFE83_04865 [Lachnospiraceae bacterium]|jgi:hypothetical protein|nr:hypothetical protein [Lachnospiraceae bacterium]
MAKKKNKKIIRYRRPLNINVGMIVFALIFVYMAFYAYTYVKHDKIEFYEVVEGGIVSDRHHAGIIFREEETKYTDRAGNINYYMREGGKAAVGARIYSIDETGTLSSLLAERAGGTVMLSAENLAALKKELSAFSQTFTNENFRELYDTKNDLDYDVLELVNVDTLKNLDSVIEEMGVDFVQARADVSGVVSYTVDSFDSMTPNQVTAELFDKSGYTKKSIKSSQMVEIGAPAYKLVTSSDWSIVFELAEDEAALYNGRTSLPVKFGGKNLQTTGAFSVITGADGGMYGRLDFSKYMEQFINDRFVDFEIVTEDVRGLKIPRSSVTEVNFYLIPKDFLVRSETGQNLGFYKEVYTEGTSSVVLTPCSIYNSDEDYYYVGTEEGSGLTAGDYLIKENSEERYQVGVTASVQGVYNINRGYTAFRKIEPLLSNDEYYTIKKGSEYGLSVYDHIVLDVAAVTGNGMVLYQ